MANNGKLHHHDNGHLIEEAERIATQEFEALDAPTAIEEAVRLILLNVGEDPDRDGLIKTPQRVARMYGEMLEGYQQDVETIINGALFDVEYGEGEMVVVANIEYTSMCEHHMLPFTGQAHIAYIPRKKVVGLSKIPRIVDMFARRLQVQERLTNEIADALHEYLDPAGVIVVIAGQHSCAALRGVKKHGVNMVTTAKRGEFRTNRDLRDEFYRLAGIS
jgi:GTP cyclohydrolase I